MLYDYNGIILTLFILFPSIHSFTQSLNNITFGHIENLNFYLGQSQPANTSCSWIINNPKETIQSYYVLSLRIIELENDPTQWSNELILTTDNNKIIVNDIKQRTIVLPSSSSLQIDLHPKSPGLQSTSLNIQRFLLEFIYVNNKENNKDYFHCVKSGLIIPKQWKCNCIYECLFNDFSDEDNCPLCSIIKSTNSLLCHSNEIWCLPMITKSLFNNPIQSYRKIDPKGVCIPREQNPQCHYSTNSSNCETIISYYQDRGELLLDNSKLSNHQSLCFIIIAKEQHKIKLIINQYDFITHFPDLELLIYDGSEEQKHLLVSPNWLFIQQVVQTHENHIVTIIIRKRSIENQNSISIEQYIDNDVNETKKQIQSRDIMKVLLNVTWFTSLCPDNQFVCNGRYETKCYSSNQRCDGVWDCISGDDEIGCSPVSCPTTFSCNDPIRIPSDQPRCYTWSERCNGNAFCANRTDEKNCSNWWCNSNNGTFLCKNFNCIYETWVCDGSDDCGDNSDEKNCPVRIPRRIMTATVIGASVCCTLFIIALGCTCKLFHLRSAERQASSRLSNPQQYIEQRRRSNRHRTSITTDNASLIPSDTRRVAPPSYNQTMGLTDENEERHAALAEHLRLAGLSNFIPLPSIHSNARVTRQRNRRHRRHRRHHHRRTSNEGSRIPLLEPTVIHPTTAFAAPSVNRFDRFRSQLRSLFTPNSSTNISIQSNDIDIFERQTSAQPIVLTTRSLIESRDLPPPYTQEQLLSTRHERDIQSSTTTPTAASSSLIRIRKRRMPLNTIRDPLESQPSSLPAITTMEDDEQASSDDDKMLMP